MTTAVGYAGEEPLRDATLKDCYALALQRSESLAIQQEDIREAQGRFSQILSEILPRVSFESSEKKQGGAGGSPFTLTHVPQRQFVFSQPLFSGFKDFAALAASKAEQKQLAEELKRARQTLLRDVSDAFYLIKNYQEDLKVLVDIASDLKDRVVELKKREELGRSRASDVASTEARIYQIEADTQIVQSQYDVAGQFMEFLTGRKIVSIADEEHEANLFSSQEDYADGVNSRPDVLAAGQAKVAAQKKVAVARAGYFPTVSVDGNSYTKRVGASAGVDWDVTLQVKVPLFDGLHTKGEIDEARAASRSAELSENRVKRQAVLDVQNSYTQYQGYQKQRDALKKAVDAAQESYDLQLEDYKNGLVNNLDVLQALQDLLTMRRNYIAVQNTVQRAYWNLRIAAGDITDDTF
ncbi:MAG: hypothetical protein A2Z81_04275 [Omnitrophica WOR_2 bacterium GWA2_45_18]|nr:MAG: hypothetical protein A2Z81_04275 [Omnitrophica WOR_2 bacterium GWA2_45_18]